MPDPPIVSSLEPCDLVSQPHFVPLSFWQVAPAPAVGMPTKSAPALPATDEQRAELQRMAASTTLPHRKVVQARGLLWATQGVSNQEISGVADWTPTPFRHGAGSRYSQSI